MSIEVSAAGVIDRTAVKSMPAATGIGGWGSWGWYDRTPQTTYDYAKFHKLDVNAIIVLAQGWICDHCGLGRIVVGREEDDGTYTPVSPHPLTKRLQPDGSIGLLRRPNPWESWEETLGATVCDLIFGNAYWLLPEESPLVDPEIYWLPAIFVWPEPETDLREQRQSGPVRAYWYGETAYPPDRVLHFRDRMLDPYRRWLGRNRVAAQIGSAAAVDLLLRFTVANLRNGHGGKVMAPRESLGAVVLPGSADEKAMLALAKRISQASSGENVGDIVPSSVPLDLLDLGRGPEEMALDRIGDLPIALLLSCLGLNMLALDLPGSAAVSTFANKAEAHRHALEYAVVTREDLIASKIASGLLPLYQKPPADSCWWDRKDVEALKENANDRATRAVTLYQGKLTSINESRSIVELPPVDGGDQTPVEQEMQDFQHSEIIAGRQAATNPPADGRNVPQFSDGQPQSNGQAKAIKAKASQSRWITVWSRRRNRYVHVLIEGNPAQRGERKVQRIAREHVIDQGPTLLSPLTQSRYRLQVVENAGYKIEPGEKRYAARIDAYNRDRKVWETSDSYQSNDLGKARRWLSRTQKDLQKEIDTEARDLTVAQRTKSENPALAREKHDFYLSLSRDKRSGPTDRERNAALAAAYDPEAAIPAGSVL